MAKKAKPEFLTEKDFTSSVDLSDYFGEGTPYRSLENEIWSDIPSWTPTGAISLDFAIGGYIRGKRGGIPHRRATEIWGPESSGKSVLLDHIMLNWCRSGGVVLLADRENSHEEGRLVEIGLGPYLKSIRYIQKPVKVDGDTVFTNDYSLEYFMESAENGVKQIRDRNKTVSILVALDSLAYLSTDAQEKVLNDGEDFNMKTMLDMSKILSQRFNNFCSKITKNNSALVVVNQFRQKPNQLFGDPDYSPGGNAKNHAFSLRIKLDAGQRIKAADDPTRTHEGDDPVGILCSFVINKNKVAPPFRRGRFSLYFDDRGIFHEETFAHLLVDRRKFDYSEHFEKSGVWYSWKGERIGQGLKGLVNTFVERPEIMYEMEAELFLKEIGKEEVEENGE